MRLDAALERRAVWLSLPLVFGNGALALVAAAYALGTLPLQGLAGAGTFSVLAIVATGVVIGSQWAVAMTRLRTLRALAQARGATDPAQVTRALHEVRTLGAALGWAVIAGWVLASAGVALAEVWLSDVPAAVAWRIGALGIVFGPMAGLLVSLWVTVRSHAVVELLAKAMPVSEALAALPPAGRSLKRMVLLITTLSALLPTVAVVDLVQSLGGAAAARVASAATAELRQQIVDDVVAQVLLSGGLLVVVFTAVALLVGWAAATALTEPMRRIADDASRIARGEVSPATVVAADAEVMAVTAGFSRMKDRLRQLVEQLHGAAAKVDGSTALLTGATAQYQQGASQQAAALNQTSATTEELAHSAKAISGNAGAVLDIADETLKAAESGQASADAFQAAVERMRRENQLIGEAVDRLHRRVQQIGRIVEVINGVADRADLLALSAELEGTRAGEVGRGFSLVATEMRRLAENVLESTAEVEELITEIRDATRITTDATQKGSQLARASMAIADEVDRALHDVGELAKDTSRAVRSISLATQQQESGTDQLAEAMADILGATQVGINSTRQLSMANERLGGLAVSLRGAVDRFRIVP